MSDIPPPPPCLTLSPPPNTSSFSSTRSWDGKNEALLVVGCTGSLMGVLAFIFFCFFFTRYYHCSSTSSRLHDSAQVGRVYDEELAQAEVAAARAPPRVVLDENRLIHLEEFSFQVLQKITENFSEEHKIGKGSFGSVYRATLNDGREVAIKRAEVSASSSSSSYSALYGRAKRYHGVQVNNKRAFLNERGFMYWLNHKNVLRLIGYCCYDNDERMLILEFMENGTLHHHLHSSDTNNVTASQLMSWNARIRVALDVARGIEYLHEYAVPQVIHRDIKSSNILLDANWNAKVSDFGLSVVGPKGCDDDNVSHVSLLAAGTMGYMDPENYRLQVVTTKNDVYSFGVVLLELLSGRRAIQNEKGVPINVVDYVVPYILQDNIARVLDVRVPSPTPFEMDEVACVGYLAADCVMLPGRDRPTMTEIVKTLERALAACLAPPMFSPSNTDDSSIQQS